MDNLEHGIYPKLSRTIDADFFIIHAGFYMINWFWIGHWIKFSWYKFLINRFLLIRMLMVNIYPNHSRLINIDLNWVQLKYWIGHAIISG